MEKLIVKNFLTLQDIELDIKKINIIIGRQSEGKSILAKLVYFFKNFFEIYFNSVIKQQDKRQFDKDVRDEFQQMFARYTWQNQNFEISYLLDDFSITISNIFSKNNRINFKLDYSNNLLAPRKQLTQQWKKIVEKDINQDFKEKLGEFLPLFKRADLSFEGLIFMPAGRSFFSIVEDNIFSFLGSNISMDYFLREFGSSYQFFKNVYREFFIEENNHQSQYLFKIKAIINQVLSGQYYQEKSGDYILLGKTKQKVRISDASSGQQEFLPIAVVLTLIPFLNKLGTNHHLIFIEEPEAHLFPFSQKLTIDLIARTFNYSIKNNQEIRLFLTTHSPYILTSFNNLIQAGNTLKVINDNPNKDTKKKLKNQLFKIIDEDQILDVNDFSVYILQQGKLENIIDQETQLINAHLIDEISDEIGDIFDQLLSLEIQEL